MQPILSSGKVALGGLPEDAPKIALGGKGKQAIALTFPDELLEALQEAQHASGGSGEPPMRVEFGGNPGLHVGDKFIPVIASSLYRQPQELYTRTPDASGKPSGLQLVGGITAKITLRRELSAKMEQKMHERTVEAEQERTGRKAIILDEPPPMVNGKKIKFDAGGKGAAGVAVKKPGLPSRPTTASGSGSSQAVPAARTSLPPKPTLAVRPGASLPKRPQPNPNGPASNTLEARIVHCLACGPRTFDSLTKGVGAPGQVVRPILERLAMPMNPGVASPAWTLRTESYKLVDIWLMTNWSMSDRQRVLVETEKAFHTLKLPERCPERAALRAAKERLTLELERGKAQAVISPIEQHKPPPPPPPVLSPPDGGAAAARGIGQKLTSSFKGGVIKKDKDKKPAKAAGVKAEKGDDGAKGEKAEKAARPTKAAAKGKTAVKPEPSPPSKSTAKSNAPSPVVKPAKSVPQKSSAPSPVVKPLKSLQQRSNAPSPRVRSPLVHEELTIASLVTGKPADRDRARALPAAPVEKRKRPSPDEADADDYAPPKRRKTDVSGKPIKAEKEKEKEKEKAAAGKKRARYEESEEEYVEPAVEKKRKRTRKEESDDEEWEEPAKKKSRPANVKKEKEREKEAPAPRRTESSERTPRKIATVASKEAPASSAAKNVTTPAKRPGNSTKPKSSTREYTPSSSESEALAPAPAPKPAPKPAPLNVQYSKLYIEYSRLNALLVEQQDLYQRAADGTLDEHAEAGVMEEEELGSTFREFERVHAELQGIVKAAETLRGAA